MALAFVGQQASGLTGDGPLVHTVTGSGFAAGDLIVLAIGTTNPSITINVPTDSKGNTYAIAVQRTATGGWNTCIAYAVLTAALLAGDTITLTASGVVTFFDVVIGEWSGSEPHASVLDQVAGPANGTSAAPASGATPTTTQADELVIGTITMDGVADITWTPGTGYTGLTEDTRGGNREHFMEYKIVSATGTFNGDAATSESAPWFAACATFKALSGPPAQVYYGTGPDFTKSHFPFLPMGDTWIQGRGRPSVGKRRGPGPSPQGGFERFIFPRLHPIILGAPQFFDLAVATETDTAQSLTFAKAFGLPVATETDVAQALAFSKAFSLALAAETDTAQPLAFSKALGLPVASETDSAQALTFAKSVTLTVATETDVAQALAFSKAFTLPIGTETDVAQALIVAAAGGQSFSLTIATETDTAQALAFLKSLSLPIALETDVAQAISLAKAFSLVPATEADAAQPFTFAKVITLPIATESDVAVAFVITGGGGGPAPPAFHTIFYPRAMRSGIYTHASRQRKGHGFW